MVISVNKMMLFIYSQCFVLTPSIIGSKENQSAHDSKDGLLLYNSFLLDLQKFRLQSWGSPCIGLSGLDS